MEVMIIRFDYDNNKIRIGSDDSFDVQDSNMIIEFDCNYKEMKFALPLISEIANMIMVEAGNNANFGISISKQDDGEITSIEEY